MKRTLNATNIIRFAAFACLSLLSVGASNEATAGVITVADLNLGDLMSITSNTNTANGVTVTESYGESTLIPYITPYPILPDAEHYAVVTQNKTYFDKVVTYSGIGELDITEFEFEITNNTPWHWKDYHFEIWDTTFTARQQAPWASPNPPANLATLFSDQFTGLGLYSNVGTFYSAPGSGETHSVLEVGTYTLRMELYAFNSTGAGEFGLRQVATAVPEPGSMAIFGIGCSLAMVMRRRRRNRLAVEESAAV